MDGRLDGRKKKTADRGRNNQNGVLKKENMTVINTLIHGLMKVVRHMLEKTAGFQYSTEINGPQWGQPKPLISRQGDCQFKCKGEITTS